MLLKELSIFHFRNYENLSLRFSPGQTILVGKNGQGKTNLLEAVLLLSIGRSPRTSLSRELIQEGRDQGSIHASWDDSLGSQEISLQITSRRKLFSVNGKQTHHHQALGKLLTVSFFPQDLDLVRGGSQLRREFLDRHLVNYQAEALEALQAYNKALKSKQELLSTLPKDKALLSPWNALMGSYGALIRKSRKEFVKNLQNYASEFYKELSGNTEMLKISYAQKDSSTTEEELTEELERVRTQEMTTGRTVVGPHKDDLDLVLQERSARSFASQGQARSIVLSLKLAAFEAITSTREETPIVLLDDVDSELDPFRRERFYRILSQKNAQTITTTTDESPQWVSQDSACQIVQIAEGTVRNTVSHALPSA